MSLTYQQAPLKYRAEITIYIDQDLYGTRDEVDAKIDSYIGELAQARGELTWSECNWILSADLKDLPFACCETCKSDVQEADATEIGLGTGVYVCETCWINN